MQSNNLHALQSTSYNLFNKQINKYLFRKISIIVW